MKINTNVKKQYLKPFNCLQTKGLWLVLKYLLTNNIHIYIYGSKSANKSDTMKKRWKINNPKFDEFIMKVDVERFGCKNLLQDFKFMKIVRMAMDVWWNNRKKESVHNTIFSVLIFENIITLLSRGQMFEICWVSKAYNGRWLKLLWKCVQKRKIPISFYHLPL